VNVQDLLLAIQEELDSPYFSSYLRGWKSKNKF
jgi:hypothetical protein